MVVESVHRTRLQSARAAHLASFQAVDDRLDQAAHALAALGHAHNLDEAASGHPINWGPGHGAGLAQIQQAFHPRIDAGARLLLELMRQ